MIKEQKINGREALRLADEAIKQPAEGRIVEAHILDTKTACVNFREILSDARASFQQLLQGAVSDPTMSLQKVIANVRRDAGRFDQLSTLLDRVVNRHAESGVHYQGMLCNYDALKAFSELIEENRRLVKNFEVEAVLLGTVKPSLLTAHDLKPLLQLSSGLEKSMALAHREFVQFESGLTAVSLHGNPGIEEIAKIVRKPKASAKPQPQGDTLFDQLTSAKAS